MSKSNGHETAYLKLVFTNVAIANIGNAAGLQPSGVAGSLYVALYSTDPTDADSGTEIVYTSYARVAVARTVGGWTVSGNQVENAAVITFPTSTGGSDTATHFGIRTASSGGDLIGSGALNSSIAIASSDIPKFNAGDSTVTED